MAARKPPLRIQVIVVVIATFAWVTQLIVAALVPRLPVDTGATDAFFAVLAAAMTFPEINKFRNRHKGPDEDEE